MKQKRNSFSDNTYHKMKKIKRCKCGSMEDLQIHHIKHLSEGGTNKFDNLVKLCAKCHRKKHGAKR